jgi:hypothetical protein
MKNTLEETFVFDAEIAPKELQARRTKNYGQFKKIVGNRTVNMGHVNNLTKMIATYNLLPQFVGVVTKDGFIVDGQHRLKSAEVNKLWFYFTIIPETVDDIIVAVVNSAQLRWRVDDYINFYADRGNAQYIWLRDLHNEYRVGMSTLVYLFGVKNLHSSAGIIRNGTLQFFTNQDEEQYLMGLLDGYLKLKAVLDQTIYYDRDFVQALRKIFEQVSVEQVLTAIEKYGKAIVLQHHEKDYLRLFEEVINKGKHEGSQVRFF